MNRPVKREPRSTANINDQQAAIPTGPDTTTTDRRFVRSRYVAVKHLINDEKEDVGKPDSDKFQRIMDQVDNLHNLVQKPREQVADAEALLDITNFLFTSVRAQNKEGITASEFVDCVLRDFGQQDGSNGSNTQGSRCSIGWKDIGLAVSHIFNSCHGCATMIGPMDTEVKHRKAVVRKHRVKPTDRVQPDEVNDNAARMKTDTDKNMAIMFGILKSKRCVKLESLVLNRSSFAQTVENLFALSFLVKDGRAEIKVDENHQHVVSPRNAPAASEVIAGNVVYRHFVFRFDFKDWKLMTSVVEVGEELMPNRTSISMSSTDQAGAEYAEAHEAVGTSKSDSIPEGETTTPIRKLSRNRGLVLQEDTIVADSSPDSTDTRARGAAIRKGKRKVR